MPDGRTLRFPALCLLVLLGGACAPVTPQVPNGEGPPETAPSAAETISLFGTRDTELFERAIARLSAPASGQALFDAYSRARADLAILLQAYPESRWRPAGETITALIDRLTSQHRLLERNATDKSRLARENDHLKRQVRTAREKLQAETAKLTQENEQLRKNIQTLKQLEIELEKRDRKLR